MKRELEGNQNKTYCTARPVFFSSKQAIYFDILILTRITYSLKATNIYSVAIFRGGL